MKSTPPIRISIVWIVTVLMLLPHITTAFTSPQQFITVSTRNYYTNEQQQYETVLQAESAVIKGEDIDSVPMDPGSGGVRLAQESVLKVTGTVKHKPGSATAQTDALKRYTKLTEVSDSIINNMKEMIRVVCTGIGIELYRDPGETTIKEVTLAPLDAVRDATMNAAGTTQDVDELVINICGSDDLQMNEVLDAVQQMAINLDEKTSCKISFNSISHYSIPKDKCFLSVIAMETGEDVPLKGGLKGAEKAIANGELYVISEDGKYGTVTEEDINTAVE